MPITMMTVESEAGLPNVNTVYNHPLHQASTWRHGRDCPHRDSDRAHRTEALLGCISTCGQQGPLFLKITHVGLVLKVGERNYHEDSDFYAIVWNPEKQMPETVEYATTRGWTYPNSAAVDATPETVALYEAHRARVRAEERALREADEAATPRVGKKVKVVRGRKVPQGTVATVFWVGQDKFRSHKYDNPNVWMLANVMVLDKPERLGLLLPDGSKQFVSAENVEVTA